MNDVFSLNFHFKHQANSNEFDQWRERPKSRSKLFDYCLEFSVCRVQCGGSSVCREMIDMDFVLWMSSVSWLRPPSWWLASGTLAVERRRTSHTQLQFNCGLDIDRTFTFTSCRHLAPCRSEVTHKVTQMRLTEHSEKQSSVIRVRWRVDLSSPWNCLSYFESGF